MSTSTSTTSLPSQDFLGDFHTRRLLLHTTIYNSPTEADPPATGNTHNSSETSTGHGTFDANIVMVLSVLLCALICSLALNSIMRCALRCSSLAASQSARNSSDPSASRGVKRKALKTFPTVIYSTDSGLDVECVICLSEFTAGERVLLLPKCNHGFHVRCIDKWLTLHSSCPTCRHCLIKTCHKIVGCDQASSSHPPPQHTAVNIPALEPEGLIRTYRGIM